MDDIDTSTFKGCNPLVVTEISSIPINASIITESSYIPVSILNIVKVGDESCK